MSSTIALHPTTRHAVRSLSHLSHRSSPSPSRPISSPSPSVVPFPKPSLPSKKPSDLTSVNRYQIFTPNILPSTFLSTLRAYHRHVHLPLLLSLYTSDLFSAARHHNQLDGTLLTASARRDVEALAKAGRVIGRDLAGAEILRGAAAGGTSTRLFGREQDIETEDEGSESYHTVDEVGSERSKSDSTSGFHPYQLQDQVPVLDVSEADIARIVPRVISHRLRVRDGPEDEILGSTVFGAVKGKTAIGGDYRHEANTETSDWERSTVKEILVKILSEV